MANTLGGVLGYLLVGPFLNILPTRKEIDEASFCRGREVSLARRLLALTIDVPCAGLFALVLEALLPIARDTAWFSFFGTYFVLIPVLLRGRTVGKLILRIGILSEDGQPRALVSVSSPLRQPLGSALCPSGHCGQRAGSCSGCGGGWA